MLAMRAAPVAAGGGDITKGFYLGKCYEWQWQGTAPFCAHGGYCDGMSEGWTFMYEDDGWGCCSKGNICTTKGGQCWSPFAYTMPGPAATSPDFGSKCLSGNKALCRRPATGCTQ